MTEKVKTVMGCYFLLPDFSSRGHPRYGAVGVEIESYEGGGIEGGG